MKRISIAIYLLIMVLLIGVWSECNVVLAEEDDVDISFILSDNALVGHAATITKGVYFSDGTSIINKISSSKVGAGGVTNAAKKCTVKITCILEKETSGGWERVTSWTQTNLNAYSAMISKSVSVGSGYYYRVRSYHNAGSDSATSFTGALYVGN